MQTHHNLRQDHNVFHIWLELFAFFVRLVEILILLTAILFVNHTIEPNNTMGMSQLKIIEPILHHL
jgi:hypothetical protein